MAQKRASVTFLTPDCTVVFPSFVTARVRTDKKTGKPFPNAVPKFEGMFAFPIDAYEKFIVPKMTEVLEADFGPDGLEALDAVLTGKRCAYRVPFQTAAAFNARRVAAGKEAFADLVGTILVSATSHQQPGVVDLANKEINASLITGGSTVCAELVFKTMEAELFVGGVCYVNNLQLVKAAGRRSPTEVFKPRSAGTTGVNPFKKQAEEGPPADYY